jgi:hypothetical protein
MDGTETEHIDPDKPSSRLQGIGAGMTLDFDPGQYPCALLAQMWYEILAKAA